MQQGLICIMDMLGTKSFWTEISTVKYFQCIDLINETLDDAKTQFRDLYHDAPYDFDFISFSDTLVITFTKTEIDEVRDPYLFREFIYFFSRHILGIFQIVLSEEFLLRGAISFGLIEKRGHHFIGQAVDDVAEYFELPDMIGICLTPKASIAMDNAIEWYAHNYKIMIDEYWVKYKTPLKNGKDIMLYQINWIKHFFEEKNRIAGLTPIGVLSSLLSKRNIPVTAISKFTNTINFFNEVGKLYNS